MNGWIALLAVLGAVDPLRRDRSPGGGIGSFGSFALFVAAAALSGPLLDWLAISEPNIQVAAALVLLVAALVEVVAPGRIQATPVVVLLAIAIGANLGVWRAVAIAAVAHVAVHVTAAVAPGRRAVGIALSVIAAVAAVDLAVDGVLAV